MAVPVVGPPAAPKRRGCTFCLGVVAAGFLALVALGYLINRVQEEQQSPADKEAKEKEQVRIAFAAGGAKQLRDAMRNPDSFKLTQALIMGDGAVCYDYRAQNGFGGMNAEKAVLAPDGRFATTGSDGFHALWNKECADKTGLDETWAVGYVAGFHGALSGQ